MVSGDRSVYQYGKPIIKADDSDTDLAAMMPLRNDKDVLIGGQNLTAHNCLTLLLTYCIAFGYLNLVNPSLFLPTYEI